MNIDKEIEKYNRFHNARANQIEILQKSKCVQLLKEMGRNETFESTSESIRADALYLAIEQCAPTDLKVWLACAEIKDKEISELQADNAKLRALKEKNHD